MARRFATGFLSPVVAPALLHMEEKVVRYETLFVKKMLEKLESKPMVSAMVDFLLGVFNNDIFLFSLFLFSLLLLLLLLLPIFHLLVVIIAASQSSTLDISALCVAA